MTYNSDTRTEKKQTLNQLETSQRRIEHGRIRKENKEAVKVTMKHEDTQPNLMTSDNDISGDI